MNEACETMIRSHPPRALTFISPHGSEVHHGGNYRRGTIVALNWVLAAGMANEIDAEKRRSRRAAFFSSVGDEMGPRFATKDAA